MDRLTYLTYYFLSMLIDLQSSTKNHNSLRNWGEQNNLWNEQAYMPYHPDQAKQKKK